MSCWSVLSPDTLESLSAGQFFLSGRPPVCVCCSVLLVTSFSQDTFVSLLFCPTGHFFLSGHPDISVCCSVLLVTSFSRDTLKSLSAGQSCWSLLSLNTLESLSAALFCWSVFFSQDTLTLFSLWCQNTSVKSANKPDDYHWWELPQVSFLS